MIFKQNYLNHDMIGDIALYELCIAVASQYFFYFCGLTQRAHCQDTALLLN